MEMSTSSYQFRLMYEKSTSPPSGRSADRRKSPLTGQDAIASGPELRYGTTVNVTSLFVKVVPVCACARNTYVPGSWNVT